MSRNNHRAEPLFPFRSAVQLGLLRPDAIRQREDVSKAWSLIVNVSPRSSDDDRAVVDRHGHPEVVTVVESSSENRMLGPLTRDLAIHQRGTGSNATRIVVNGTGHRPVAVDRHRIAQAVADLWRMRSYKRRKNLDDARCRECHRASSDSNASRRESWQRAGEFHAVMLAGSTSPLPPKCQPVNMVSPPCRPPNAGDCYMPSAKEVLRRLGAFPRRGAHFKSGEKMTPNKAAAATTAEQCVPRLSSRKNTKVLFRISRSKARLRLLNPPSGRNAGHFPKNKQFHCRPKKLTEQ